MAYIAMAWACLPDCLYSYGPCSTNWGCLPHGVLPPNLDVLDLVGLHQTNGSMKHSMGRFDEKVRRGGSMGRFGGKVRWTFDGRFDGKVRRTFDGRFDGKVRWEGSMKGSIGRFDGRLDERFD